MTAGARDRTSGWGGVAQLLGIVRRSEAAAELTIGVLLAVVASLIALAPGALHRAESDSLERALAEAPPQRMRLAVRALEEFGPGDLADPVAEQRATAEDAASVIPDSVSSYFGEPRLIVDSGRFVVTAIDSTPRPSPITMTLRVHPELEEHSRIVEGRAARPGIEMTGAQQVIEFELSTMAAEVLDLELGDLVELEPDTTDVVTRRFDGGLPDPFAARLVGLRELDPVDDPYWFGDARLHRPVVMDTGVGAEYVVFGSIPAGALPDRPFLVAGRGPLLVEQRRDLLAAGVSIDEADELQRGLDALAASAATDPTPGRAAIVTGLGAVLEAEQGQRSVARSSVVLAAVGALGVALVTLVLCLQVALHRRREWLTIARARGASARQIVIAGTLEMTVVAGVAVVFGLLVSRVVGADRFGEDGDGSAAPTVVAMLLLLWFGSIVTTGWTLIADVRRTTGATDGAGREHALGRSGRVAAMLLVAVTGGALVTFLRGGVAADGDGIDGLAVLLPVLLSLSVGLAVAWVLPALLGSIARGGMSLGPGRLVGTRRAMIRGGAGTGLVVVLTMALAIAGLGSGISRSLGSSITAASWTAVGAPYRIETADAEVAEAVAAIEGAELVMLGDAPLNVDRDGERFGVRLLTVDAEGITGLTAGASADPSFPEELVTLDAAGRIPVVSSARLDGRLVRPGDTVSSSSSSSSAGSAAVVFVIVEARDELFGRETDWIAADAEVLTEAMGRSVAISALLFDIPRSGRSALDDIVAGGELELQDRAATAARLHGDPLVQLVRRAYVVSSVVAVLLALVAVAALAVLSARQRRRDVGLLRLLGAGHDETGRAIRSELVPPCAIGIVFGTLLGWWTANLFDGRFDLASFAGGADVVLGSDVTVQLLTAVAVIGAVWAMLAIMQRRTGRTSSSAVLGAQEDR